jgi:gentisate 1,2-dioxygenase
MTPSRSPVRVRTTDGPDQPEPSPELAALYHGFESELLVPLWTEIGDLMPSRPGSRALPHLWRWRNLLPMAERAGRLVPVGRGGERRAVALANPGLGGRPFATPTLWAAIQYLNPGEDAPVHRHTQHAFRFVVEGEGVWTVVNGDPVAMRRGDFLPQGGWHWHGHHNLSDRPMAWIDGLDIPFQHYADATFFEFGPEHQDPAGETVTAREVGSSVYQVFDGSGRVTVGETSWEIGRGDLFVVPSWQPLTVASEPGLDLFRFSDAPIHERLGLHRRDGAVPA